MFAKHYSQNELNFQQWPKYKHSVVKTDHKHPVLPTTLLLYWHFDWPVTSVSPYSVVQWQILCHTNPDVPPTLLLALPTSLAGEESDEGKGEGDEENMQRDCVEWEKRLQGWRRKGVKRKRGGCAGKEVMGCRKRRGWTRKKTEEKNERKTHRERTYLNGFLLRTVYTTKVDTDTVNKSTASCYRYQREQRKTHDHCHYKLWSDVML